MLGKYNNEARMTITRNTPTANSDNFEVFPSFSVRNKGTKNASVNIKRYSINGSEVSLENL